MLRRLKYAGAIQHEAEWEMATVVPRIREMQIVVKCIMYHLASES